jgi:hypothetical protein
MTPQRIARRAEEALGFVETAAAEAVARLSRMSVSGHTDAADVATDLFSGSGFAMSIFMCAPGKAGAETLSSAPGMDYGDYNAAVAADVTDEAPPSLPPIQRAVSVESVAASAASAAAPAPGTPTLADRLARAGSRRTRLAAQLLGPLAAPGAASPLHRQQSLTNPLGSHPSQIGFDVAELEGGNDADEPVVDTHTSPGRARRPDSVESAGTGTGMGTGTDADGDGDISLHPASAPAPAGAPAPSHIADDQGSSLAGTPQRPALKRLRSLKGLAGSAAAEAAVETLVDGVPPSSEHVHSPILRRGHSSGIGSVRTVVSSAPQSPLIYATSTQAPSTTAALPPPSTVDAPVAMEIDSSGAAVCDDPITALEVLAAIAHGTLNVTPPQVGPSVAV